MAFGKKPDPDGRAASSNSSDSFDPRQRMTNTTTSYAAPTRSTTSVDAPGSIVDVMPPIGSYRRDNQSSNSSNSSTTGSISSRKSYMKNPLGKLRSKFSISQSISQTSSTGTINENEEQHYSYPHRATSTSPSNITATSNNNNNNNNLYTSNDAAFQLQAALSKSLSITSSKSCRSYNSSYSEDAFAGDGSHGTNPTSSSIAHTINSTKKKFRLPNRYRGFSTSISSLFLDESIVCGALSCCGVILSSRTEYLLNERNVRRGVTRRGGGYGKEGATRAPSKILGISWIVTIVALVMTFVIWGFGDGGSGGEYEEYYEGDYWAYDDDDDGNDEDARRKLKKTFQKHSFAGIMKLRDYREHVFDPVLRVATRTYATVKSQFNDEEYTPGIHQQQRLLNYDDDYYSSDDDIASTTRMVIILIFLFLLGVVGRRRRMRTRFTIQRARTADDHIYYASLQPPGQSVAVGGTKGGTKSAGGAVDSNDSTFHEREDQWDGACSHTICGCYPVDNMKANYADYREENSDNAMEGGGDQQTTATGDNNSDTTSVKRKKKKKRRGGDFVNRAMTTAFNLCCGSLCKCWCQVFSICALAQEARETRLLVPPSMQRVDLITHQPFHEYASDVNNVRRRFMERTSMSWMQHYAALSHLSRYILVGFVFVTALVVFTMLAHPSSWFTWGDALVLIATFTQSFLVLMVVFGIFHRSDLSFDAVVKFFAVGFCICVPVGVVFEGIMMNGLVSILYVVYFLLSVIMGQTFDNWMQDNNFLFWFAGELIGAYLVAALVEELCKYYGFRFVEHPDLIFLTGLDRSAEQAKTAGGVNAYKFDSQLVSEFSRSTDIENMSIKSSRSKNSRMSRLRPEDEEYDEPELRTVRQQAAAITTGMISVAVGLACAENFMYVFFLGGSRGNSGAIWQELMILLFRSIFPVHALAAAMQSINMIKKFVEEPQSHIGVGRIILPAVLTHGTFDAILLSITTYIETKYEQFYENGGQDGDPLPFNALVVNTVAWASILGLMSCSFAWFMVHNKRQMKRLSLIEVRGTVNEKPTSLVFA